MKTLLIVAHAPSVNTQFLLQSIERSASKQEGVNIVVIEPLLAQAEHLHSADGVLLFTPENFGYMSGALKDMFDRTYYELIETKRGMPYSLVIRAGKDGTGCKRAVESITKGLGWSAVQETLILQGEYDEQFHTRVSEVAESFAAGLAMGIF